MPPRERIDVPTAGKPVEAVAATARERWGEPGGAYRVTVAHDEGCPCAAGSPLPECTCEIVELVGRRIA